MKKPRGNVLSLRVIAAKLKCSRATVSYALRNQTSISEETRIKVQTVARQLGWRPDAELARVLSLVRTTGRHSSPNLAIVFNKPPSELVEQHTPRKHLWGAKRRAIDLGYILETFNLAEHMLSPARLRGVLRARGVQGVVYLATTDTNTTLDPAYMEFGKDFACSVLGVWYPDPPFHVAISNLHVSGQLAMKRLLAAGFRRPGAVLPTGLDRALAWSFGGGIQAGSFEQPPGDRVPICYAGHTENYIPDYSFPDIEDWMQRYRPDVIVTADMRKIHKFLQQRPGRDRGIRVCDLDYHKGFTPDFGVDQRNEAVGAAAVDLVVAQLHRGEIGIPPIRRTLQIEGVWVSEGSMDGQAGRVQELQFLGQ